MQGEGVALGEEAKGGALGGSGSTVLDGEGEDVPFAGATQVEVAVAPGVKLGAAPEGLSCAEMSGALAGVVDEDDSSLVMALQAAQVVEQWSDLGGDIFVDAVKADERVEDEEGWTQYADSIVEALTVEFQVEAQRGSGDDLEIEIGESQLGSCADPLESLADGGEGVLGREEQDTPLSSHGEPPEAGRGGRDGHGHVESEEGLAALGLAADDANGLGAPQPLNEPALLGGEGPE